MSQLDQLAARLPQLDVTSIQQLLGSGHSRVVTGTDYRREGLDMAILIKDVGATGMTARCTWAGALPNSQSPAKAEGRAVMGLVDALYVGGVD